MINNGNERGLKTSKGGREMKNQSRASISAYARWPAHPSTQLAVLLPRWKKISTKPYIAFRTILVFLISETPSKTLKAISAKPGEIRRKIYDALRLRVKPEILPAPRLLVLSRCCHEQVPLLLLIIEISGIINCTAMR